LIPNDARRVPTGYHRKNPGKNGGHFENRMPPQREKNSLGNMPSN